MDAGTSWARFVVESRFARKKMAADLRQVLDPVPSHTSMRSSSGEHLSANYIQGSATASVVVLHRPAPADEQRRILHWLTTS
jgi:hypothetical protein